ncbi:PEP-CTERM sorting domain-containing protein [Pacificimonas sp. ICDLI1SI03]
MTKKILPFLLASAIAVPAAAVPVEIGSFDVDTQSSDPGLVIQTAPLATPLPYFVGNLAQGESTVVELFGIWTDESSISLDDYLPGSASFSITLSQPGGSGSIGGTSLAITIPFLFSEGVLTWDNNGIFDIAYGNGGIIQVDLTDATFNRQACSGFFNLNCGELNEGELFGDIVDGKFTNLIDGGPLELVPAPGALGLLGVGLLGLGAARRRRA